MVQGPQTISTKRSFRRIKIMEDPRRIFNGDESGFSLCPKTGKVLAPKGWKNLYVITSGKEKENITVFIMFNGDGKLCPSFVVYPYIRPPRALVESMLPAWILGKSPKGWMTAEAFFENISNEFNKWLIEEQIPKLVIVFIDGHKSHMSLPVEEVIFQDEPPMENGQEKERAIDAQNDLLQDPVVLNVEWNYVHEHQAVNNNKETEGQASNGEWEDETRVSFSNSSIEELEKNEDETQELNNSMDHESVVLQTLLPGNSKLEERNVDPFEVHLSFSGTMQLSNINASKAKLPSAISSQTWRHYYLKREQEKNDNITKLKLRKKQRLAIKEKKQVEKEKRKEEKENKENQEKKSQKRKKSKRTRERRPVINNDSEENTNNEKIKCTLCEEILISDTEDDSEKNIGCDHCTNWFHLKCTEFLDLPYDVTASKDYRCDLCK